MNKPIGASAVIHPDLSEPVVDPRLRHELVLEFWNLGLSAPEICTLTGYQSEQSVSSIITKARLGGDKRAVARAAGGRRAGQRRAAGRESR